MGGDSAKLYMHSRSPTAREATACPLEEKILRRRLWLYKPLNQNFYRAAPSRLACAPSARLLHSIATLQASACRIETASTSQSTLPKQTFILGAFTRSSESPAVLQRITIICNPKPSVIFWPLRSISKQRATDLHHAWKYRHRPQHRVFQGLPITNVISAEHRGHQLPPL
jgi:hypothetical protein